MLLFFPSAFTVENSSLSVGVALVVAVDDDVCGGPAAEVTSRWLLQAAGFCPLGKGSGVSVEVSRTVEVCTELLRMVVGEYTEKS